MNTMTKLITVIGVFWCFNSLSQATLTDVDGNKYVTAKIGFQTRRSSSISSTLHSSAKTIIGDYLVWMTSNLNVSKFKNGEAIIEAKSDAEWEDALNKGQPAWCYLNNDSTNGKIFGKLYNYYAVTSLKGLAPEGWHIASDEDWSYVYKTYKQYFNFNLTSDQRKGTEEDKIFMSTKWKGPKGYGNNKTGFNALPSGMRYRWSFENTGAYFWADFSLSRYNYGPFRYFLGDDYLCDGGCEETFRYGFSVRCVKDW